jgi:MoxR-vWA-beta-propeller ternary system domain bpX2
MTVLDDVCCACLPAEALPLLAGLRTVSGIRAARARSPGGDRVWLRWDAGRDEILRQLLPIEGIELFAQREKLWYRPGQALPTFVVPVESESQSLAALIVPSRCEPEPADKRTIVPVSFRLVRDEQPRTATACVCAPADLARWADQATTRELSALRAACTPGSANPARVLVLGAPPPSVADGLRYWGQRILTPLGWRPDPLLPEKSLAEALGTTPEEIVIVHEEGIEIVPLEVLAPLTRAGLRLLIQGGVHGPG